MRRSAVGRIEKLENRSNIEDIEIFIEQTIVDRDESGRLYIKYGHRYPARHPGLRVFLPKEFFAHIDPTPPHLLKNKDMCTNEKATC